MERKRVRNLFGVYLFFFTFEGPPGYPGLKGEKGDRGDSVSSN